MAERKPKESPEQLERRMLARAAQVKARTLSAAASSDAPALASLFEDFDLKPTVKAARVR
jgi:hypothetical protein